MISLTLKIMMVYLLRHGIAEERRAGLRDADRALTAGGVRRLRRVLKLVRRAGVSPAVILASPLRRAVETAAVAAQELGFEGGVSETAALSPEAPPAAIWREVRECGGDILLVGHEPHLSSLVSFLLDAPSLRADFKKAGMAAIRVDESSKGPDGVLEWMIAPKLSK